MKNSITSVYMPHFEEATSANHKGADGSTPKKPKRLIRRMNKMVKNNDQAVQLPRISPLSSQEESHEICNERLTTTVEAFQAKKDYIPNSSIVSNSHPDLMKRQQLSFLSNQQELSQAQDAHSLSPSRHMRSVRSSLNKQSTIREENSQDEEGSFSQCQHTEKKAYSTQGGAQMGSFLCRSYGRNIEKQNKIKNGEEKVKIARSQQEEGLSNSKGHQANQNFRANKYISSLRKRSVSNSLKQSLSPPPQLNLANQETGRAYGDRQYELQDLAKQIFEQTKTQQQALPVNRSQKITEDTQLKHLSKVINELLKEQHHLKSKLQYQDQVIQTLSKTPTQVSTPHHEEAYGIANRNGPKQESTSQRLTSILFTTNNNHMFKVGQAREQINKEQYMSQGLKESQRNTSQLNSERHIKSKKGYKTKGQSQNYFGKRGLSLQTSLEPIPQADAHILKEPEGYLPKIPKLQLSSKPQTPSAFGLTFHHDPTKTTKQLPSSPLDKYLRKYPSQDNFSSYLQIRQQQTRDSNYSGVSASFNGSYSKVEIDPRKFPKDFFSPKNKRQPGGQF